jgi:dihydrofolate reductase
MLAFDIVVATDDNWGIGRNNALPWPKIKGDLQHFRRVTSTVAEGQERQNAIIMGRKTWQSAEVAGRALPRRINCVVSRSELSLPEGVIHGTSLDDALRKCSKVAATVFVVGGAELYRLALQHPSLRYVYLTRVHGTFDCDTVIPNLNHDFVEQHWDGALTATENSVTYQIVRLHRK